MVFRILHPNLTSTLWDASPVWCEKAAEARSVLVESPK